jgi:hypothetical protein
MMIRCPLCSSFVPVRADAAATCPECGREPSITTTLAERPSAKREQPTPPTPAFGRRARDLAVGVSAVMTLMACYGVPYEPTGCTDPSDDRDGDGYCGDFDCDETDASIHRYAADPAGDGVDADCDGFDGPPPDASVGDAG